MLSHACTCPAIERGTSMIEVLVTMVILAFGLLGVAALQTKVGVAEMESYQRAQALLALSQISERIAANPNQGTAYVTAGTVGTGDTQPADCTGIAQGPNRDLCEWSNALKGASERSAGAKVGGMQGARGCITFVPPITTPGACAAGAYQVTVAWQGLVPTVAPANLACGAGSYGTGPNGDSYRRVVSSTVSVPTTSCQ